MRRSSLIATVTALGLAACSDQARIAGPPPDALRIDAARTAASTGSPVEGVVYVSTNTPRDNAVAIFERHADGSLSALRQVLTGGQGTGAGLGSQGAIGMSKNGRFLFVVNAGSNQISTFAVSHGDLSLVDVRGSEGIQPISLTVHGDVLYVLNAGGTANISGFSVDSRGRLVPILGSTQPLSTAAPSPAQVSFAPDGDVLVVTEKGTNKIDTYRVNNRGVARPPVVHPSRGMTPFGFAFARGDALIVSEAFGGAPNASALSSYRLGDTGRLAVISGSVATGETAACWVVVTRNGRLAFTTNTGSNFISSFAVGTDGALTLRDARAGATGKAPTDLDLSDGDRFAYALNSADGTISGFRLDSGALLSLGSTGGVPSSAVGLIAR
ncbi:MAG: beta-propeller fold lactonase family protein [Gemmatimonadaceae bacterium]